MFVSQEHHPQVLPRSWYRDAEHYDEELTRLFLPAWHCVGVLNDLPKDGSYRAIELFGNPVLLWRKENEVHAYLNVCSHRYALLTKANSGTAERLKCQYHGWEYDKTGNVRRIPDARAFKPLEQGMLGLKKYHAAVCGQLVFVSLAEDPPSLHDFLGANFDAIAGWFTPDLVTAVVCERVIDANWKCLVENALESYHTTEVHPKTFGEAPPESACAHQLESTWSALTVDFSGEKSFRTWLDAAVHRVVGAQPTRQYRHILHYPHVMLARLSLYSWFECVIPISPTKSRSVVRVLCNVGKGSSLVRRLHALWVRRWPQTFLMQVGAEDAAILPAVQAGLEATDQPLGGLISTREERIFHFQKHVEMRMQAAHAPGPQQVMPRPCPLKDLSACKSERELANS